MCVRVWCALLAYLRSLVLTTTESYFSDWINVVSRTADIGTIRLDSVLMSASNWTAIGTTGFSMARWTATPGVHRLSQDIPSKQFGVVAYGWGDFDSYAYTGGLRLAPISMTCLPTPGSMTPADGVDNDCDGRIDEEIFDGFGTERLVLVHARPWNGWRFGC